MDWQLFLNYLVKILGSALATVIITYSSILFAKLQGKIRDSKVNNYIAKVVRAAEQIFPNEGKKMGPEKYKYVVDQVLKKFKFLNDDEYLKSLIEGAVFAVSEEIKQIKESSKTNNTNNSITSF